MNFPNSNGIPPLKSRESGVALVLTLLIVSMLVVVVVGFVSVSRLEQIAARNATYQSAAEQMAQLATSQAVAQLRQAVQAGLDAGGYATQSGRLHPIGGDSQPLFSQGGGNTNINAMTSYGWVTGTANENIPVGLVNAPSVAGQVPGRTGFYIADETAKLPINFASPGRSALNPVPPRPFSIKGVDTNLQSDAVTSFSKILSGTITNNNTISNWSYFFTPEQVALAISNIGPVRSRRVTVATETNAALSGKTPWGTDKIRINEVPRTDAGVQQVVQALSDPKLAQVFGQTFAEKYTNQGLPQVAANMLQLRTDYWRGGIRFLGADPVLGTNGITNPVSLLFNRGDDKKTHGIPQEYMGYVPFPMLTEVAVGYIYGWTSANRITVRFIVECTLINPFPERFELPDAGLVVQIDKALFPIFYPDLPVDIGERYRGPYGTAPASIPYNEAVEEEDPWGDGGGKYTSLDPTQGVRIVPVGQIAPRSSKTLYATFDVVFDENRPTATADTFFGSFVILDQIRLLANTNNPTSVRDWCSGFDLFNALAPGAAGPAQFEMPYSPLNLIRGAHGVGGANLAPDSAPPPARKLVRYDPRLRPPLASSRIFQTAPPGKAWNRVTYGAGSPGPGDFLNERIPADPAYPDDLNMALYNTNLPPSMFTPDGTYAMAADLGKVFTGLPWRTLRMQPQPTNEAEDLIPDWALLDVVDFGPAGQTMTTVNPNFTYASAAAAPVVGFGAGLRSQLDVLTDTNQAGALTKLASPLTGALADSVPGLRGAGTNQTGISSMLAALSTLTNAGSWAGGAQGWKKRRDNLKFPPGALLLPSEITEVNGFANYQTTNTNLFKVNEYRLGALFPGLSTKSRFFKIYAVGEAFEGTNEVVAATALLQTLVEVNDATNPVSIRTIYQYPPTQ